MSMVWTYVEISAGSPKPKSPKKWSWKVGKDHIYGTKKYGQLVGSVLF